MKKYYESPEIEIDKFSASASVFTVSGGWGEGGDEYDGDDF
ncbi:MAG: hypothetical protein PUE08_07230 [Eubacteriales bacterium]|nr:hypothetical protein [Eubacteriales bacterium]